MIQILIIHLSRNVRKRTFGHVRPTKCDQSLRCPYEETASLAIQNASSEDSDQTVRMRRRI